MTTRHDIPRRDFLKTAAIAVPILSSGLAIARSAHAAGSDKIKVGLIGCGGRGTGAAMQAICADRGIVLTAMGDVFKDRLDSSLASLRADIKERNEKGKPADPHTPNTDQIQVAPEMQFVGFDAYQKVIDSGVDAVILTSYPNFRPAHLKYAVEKGKHIFAEKPVAVDSPGMRSVLESAAAAKNKNLALMIGFCWRHYEGMQASFDQIHSGTLGDVINVHTTYHTGTLGKNPRKPGWSDMEFQMRNWWHFTWISGDHVVEQAVHSIDRLNWALNDKLPTKISCLGGRAARNGPEHGNVFDHFSAIYEYANGQRAFHSCRQIDGCPSDNTDYIYGTKAWAAINGWNADSFVIKDYSGKELWKYKGKNEDMYQNEHDELWASIRAGKPINDALRSANSCQLALATRMAAYTGQTLTWDQALASKEDLSPAKLELGDLPTPPVAIPGKTKFV